MRKIDIKTWTRREHFELFNTFNHPHFNMCANVDLTHFLPYIRERGFSFSVAVMYAISRAANTIPAFRYRMRAGEIVEHDTVSPSITVLGENELFGFCTIDYNQDFCEFAGRATSLMAAVKDHPTLEDPPGRDDLVYMTAIPWVSFTSFAHPMKLHPADSIPRFAWGRYFDEGGLVKLPLSVQGHHALMDGIHMGRFYAEIQGYLHHPASVLGEA